MSNLRTYFMVVVISGGFLSAGLVSAEETVINNQISVSARSGGQTVSGRASGAGSTGQTRVQASVKTVVNGETVTDWQEERVATSSGEVKIEKTFVNQVAASGAAASTSVAVRARVATTTSTLKPNQRWLERWWSHVGFWWWQFFLNKQ